MIKKVYKYLIILVFLVFIFFFYFGGNIYQYKTIEKKELTEEQIKKFEQDVKDGIEIDLKDYVVKDKNYNNSITNINISISNTIEKIYKKIFEYLLKNLDV